MRQRWMVFAMILLLAGVAGAAEKKSGAGKADPQPASPRILPGKGLAEHDIFYIAM